MFLHGKAAAAYLSIRKVSRDEWLQYWRRRKVWQLDDFCSTRVFHYFGSVNNCFIQSLSNFDDCNVPSKLYMNPFNSASHAAVPHLYRSY